MQKTSKEKNEQSLNIADLLFYLLSKWIWYVLCIALCCAYAYYRYSKSSFVYFRSSTVIIKSPSEKTVTGGLDKFDSYINKVNLSNELLQFRSKNLMSQVVRRLDADVCYKQKDKLRYLELYKLSPIHVTFLNVEAERYISFDLTIKSENQVELKEINGLVGAKGRLRMDLNSSKDFHGETLLITPTEYFSNEWIGQTIRIEKLPVSVMANMFRGNLGIRQNDGSSSILTFSMVDNSGQRAEDVLNTLIEVYNEDALNDKNQISVNSANFIDERLDIIEGELRGVENELLDYKVSNDIVSLSSTMGQYLDKSNSYSDEVVNQEIQLKIYHYIKDYLEKSENKDELIPSNSGIGNKEIEAQIGQYNEFKLRRDRLIQESSTQNPVVGEIDHAMQNLRHSIIRSVDNEIVSAEVKRKDAIVQHDLAHGRLNTIPAKERDMLSIQRQQQIKESLYLYLLNKREENALSRAMADDNAKIIDAADGSPYPIDPDWKKLFAVGLMMGLAIPSVFFIFKLFMDTSIRSRKDLKDRISIPFLGEVPYDKEMGKNSKTGKGSTIINMDEGQMAESFRILRTNLAFMMKKDNHKVITFTSFNEGAGKTFTSRNLAVALAYSKKRIVMVDLDVRKRSLSHLITHAKHMGVTNFIADDSLTVDDVIYHDKNIENIDYVLAGTSAPNPAELLMDSRLDQLIDELKLRYDYVIADNVPVGIVADATISNRICDLTVFVARAGKLDRRQLPDLESLYTEGKLKNMSLVLNGVDPKYKGYGYHYGYGYGYGYRYGYRYGYGYGSSKKKKKKKFFFF